MKRVSLVRSIHYKYLWVVAIGRRGSNVLLVIDGTLSDEVCLGVNV
jgi:hypothetical protein